MSLSSGFFNQPGPASSSSTDPARGSGNHEDGRSQGSYCVIPDEDSVLQDLLKDLPQPTLPDFRADEPSYAPEGNKDSGWLHCQRVVEKHDRDLCQAYREQIDTLLVFAGLFSAVVTAFAIESYQWLLDDPADTSAELLRDITRLLAQTLNQTAPTALPAAQQLPSAAVTRINIFWFLSLTLSLSAALVGILCKQWLREFERDVGQSPEVALAVRHTRFRGLGYWKVGGFVNAVPIVLQASLALFLTGVVELLWRLHSTVAIFVTVVSTITLLLYLATTVLPLLQYTVIILRLCREVTATNQNYIMFGAFNEPQCAFKSAQAWFALRMAQPAIEYVIRTYCTIFTVNSERQPALVLRPADSWITFDLNWMKRRDNLCWGAKSAYESLAWIAENLEETHLRSSIWHCVWARWLKNRDGPRGLVSATLDMECVARAYADPVHIDIGVWTRIRCQLAMFRCSLRSNLSVDTAVEAVLRVAPLIGVDSKWTCEAVKAILDVHADHPIRLSDDMSMGLFHLAKLQTQAIIQRQGAASHNLQTHDPTMGFFMVFQLLLIGARRRDHMVPAMCSLTLQWLRSHPPRDEGVNVAERVIRDTIAYLAYLSFDPARLPAFPGIVFPARLATVVAEQSRGFANYEVQMPPERSTVFRELLRISRMDPNDVAFRNPSGWTPPTAPPVNPYRPRDDITPEIWAGRISKDAKRAKLKNAASTPAAEPAAAEP